MAESSNLKLKLTGRGDNSENFIDWRVGLDGTESTSNMQKIDAAIGKTSTLVSPDSGAKPTNLTDAINREKTARETADANHKSAAVIDHPDGSVTHIKLADNSVWANNLGSQAVTNEKIANNAVTQNKIKDGEIITSKLHDGAVTNQKIAGDSISHDKLQTNSVWEGHLGVGAVTTDKIKDGAVTERKLSTEFQEKIMQFESRIEDLISHNHMVCYSKDTTGDKRCSIDISPDADADEVAIDVDDIGVMCIDYRKTYKTFSKQSYSTTLKPLSQFTDGVFLYATMECNLRAGTTDITIHAAGRANGAYPPENCTYNAKTGIVSILLGEASYVKMNESWTGATTYETSRLPIKKGEQIICLDEVTKQIKYDSGSETLTVGG